MKTTELLLLTEKYGYFIEILIHPIRKSIIRYLTKNNHKNFREIWNGVNQPCAYKNLIDHVRVLASAGLVSIESKKNQEGQSVSVSLNDDV